MTLNEILAGGGIGIVALLTLIQISPVKIDPWSFLAKKLGKAMNGDLADKVDQLAKDLNTLSDECEKREAITVRNRILRFSDEIYHQMYHSKESFDSILLDITFYDQYCEKHPEFKNKITVMATQQIEEVYKLCMEKNKFI